jgi:hypothetical protein
MSTHLPTLSTLASRQAGRTQSRHTTTLTSTLILYLLPRQPTTPKSKQQTPNPKHHHPQRSSLPHAPPRPPLPSPPLPFPSRTHSPDSLTAHTSYPVQPHDSRRPPPPIPRKRCTYLPSGRRQFPSAPACTPASGLTHAAD